MCIIELQMEALATLVKLEFSEGYKNIKLNIIYRKPSKYF